MSKAFILILVVNLVVGLSSSAISKQKLETYNASMANSESAATASLDKTDLDLLLRIISSNLSTHQADSLQKKAEKLKNEMEVQFLAKLLKKNRNKIADKRKFSTRVIPCEDEEIQNPMLAC